MGTSFAAEEEHDKAQGYNISDNVDILAEIMSRLDGRSLGVAACVCRVWYAVCNRDSVWEALCDRHVSGGAAGPRTRSVVRALGGYRRLYRLCVGPVLDRLTGSTGPDRWTGARADSVEVRGNVSLSLSLSLFSIDCYERLSGGRQRPASLLFLSKPVDVS
ncbi:F-box protein SNE-like [Typha angustifolia]|uniref:F-box protein SNE-like n=1 Tax=Typha angustifolia TaxID=59011 RepID=UPI003C2E144E